MTRRRLLAETDSEELTGWQAYFGVLDDHASLVTQGMSPQQAWGALFEPKERKKRRR